MSDCYAQLYGSGSFCVDHFLMLELPEVMRQRGDLASSELLYRVRTNSCTSDDVRTLKSHEIAADAVAYPGHALLVDTRSTHINMLNKLAPQSAQLAMKAIDSVTCQTGHISLPLLSVGQKI